MHKGGQMRQMSALVGSHELAIIETLISFHDSVLTADDIADASSVPRASVYRILPRLIEENVLIVSGWRDRAKTYALNMADDDVASMVGSISGHVLRRTQEEMREHGIDCDPEHIEVTLVWRPPEVEAAAKESQKKWAVKTR